MTLSSATPSETAVVIGLGYVGLPLAVALARSVPTWGFDISEARVREVAAGRDRTGEVDNSELAASGLQVTANPAQCPPARFYIVTVPTPVDGANQPDMRALEAASRTVGAMLRPGAGSIVVFESTVYPGATEEVCGPILEQTSGLRRGRDFFLAYSPERINPGDRVHTVDRIIKVVSGENVEVLDAVADLYGKVTSAGVFRAASIKVAEAAKVIENTQRDINIAFVNEITQIFSKMDMSVWDVLAAARTKWNFLPFQPGLVGGHCIGVDPFYLSYRAEQLGLDPQMILAGRVINDGMAEWVAGEVDGRCGFSRPDTLVLGLTFKENVPDLRNSKVADLARALVRKGHRLTVHDPIANSAEADGLYGLSLDEGALGRSYDVVVGAVAHDAYRAMAPERWAGLVRPSGLLADLRNMAPPLEGGNRVRRWSL